MGGGIYIRMQYESHPSLQLSGNFMDNDLIR